MKVPPDPSGLDPLDSPWPSLLPLQPVFPPPESPEVDGVPPPEPLGGVPAPNALVPMLAGLNWPDSLAGTPVVVLAESSASQTDLGAEMALAVTNAVVKFVGPLTKVERVTPRFLLVGILIV